jgi:GNAT superfamily N-acetyltransferase
LDHHRRDANIPHCLAFTTAARHAFQEYCAQYGEEQTHLWLLVTHPDFRRRGAGRMLMEWGLKAAEGKMWPVTVFASPMGQLPYESLGLETIGEKVVHVEGEGVRG